MEYVARITTMKIQYAYKTFWSTKAEENIQETCCNKMIL